MDPPGYAAIIDGDPVKNGEWVPLGFTVVMDEGVTDDNGNTAQGADARIYCSRDSHAIGDQVGLKSY